MGITLCCFLHWPGRTEQGAVRPMRAQSRPSRQLRLCLDRVPRIMPVSTGPLVNGTRRYSQQTPQWAVPFRSPLVGTVQSHDLSQCSPAHWWSRSPILRSQSRPGRPRQRQTNRSCASGVSTFTGISCLVRRSADYCNAQLVYYALVESYGKEALGNVAANRLIISRWQSTGKRRLRLSPICAPVRDHGAKHLLRSPAGLSCCSGSVVTVSTCARRLNGLRGSFIGIPP